MLAPKSVRGIIAACLTPFRDGRLDVGALEREIDYIVDDCRADAISIVAVEASEYTQLSCEERKELIRRWGSYGLPPVMKAALRHLGLDISEPAPPYRGLSPADDAALGEFLANSAFEPMQAAVRAS